MQIVGDVKKEAIWLSNNTIVNDTLIENKIWVDAWTLLDLAIDEKGTIYEESGCI